jgi:hypothetical protein
MKLAAGRVRGAPLGTLVYAALLIVYDLILVIIPWDINSMSTQRPEHSNGRRERRRKGPSIYWLAQLGPQLKNRSLAMPFLAGFDFLGNLQ